MTPPGWISTGHLLCLSLITYYCRAQCSDCYCPTDAHAITVGVPTCSVARRLRERYQDLFTSQSLIHTYLWVTEVMTGFFERVGVSDGLEYWAARLINSISLNRAPS